MPYDALKHLFILHAHVSPVRKDSNLPQDYKKTCPCTCTLFFFVSFEEDFLAIHANTRGRSKLQDVRKVMIVLLLRPFDYCMIIVCLPSCV